VHLGVFAISGYTEDYERARRRVYSRNLMDQVFVADTGDPMTSEQAASLPYCISQARKQQAASACSGPGGDLALGPDTDPLVRAGLSECGIAQVRVCEVGDEAELTKAGVSATPGRRLWLVGAGVAAVGGLVYLLVRKG